MNRREIDMLRANLLLEQNEFNDWVMVDPDTEHFSGYDILTSLLALAGALATVSKGLDAGKGLIDRMKKLYRYVRGEKKSADPGLSEGERMLAMLFDAFLDGRKSLSDQRISALSGIGIEAVQRILRQFETSGIVRKRGEEWVFSSMSNQ